MTSTPTKPRILRHVPSSEAVGILDQSLLVLSQNVADSILIQLLVLVGAYDLYLRIRFRFVSFLECLYLLPCKRYRYPCLVKLSKVIHGIVISACYQIQPEPPSCEFSHQPVLVVEAITVDQYPVIFFNLPQSQSVNPVEPFLILHLTLLYLHRCSLHVL